MIHKCDLARDVFVLLFNTISYDLKESFTVKPWLFSTFWKLKVRWSVSRGSQISNH